MHNRFLSERKDQRWPDSRDLTGPGLVRHTAGAAMKLICTRCNLTLNARDEDRGKPFHCPICRSALSEAGAEGRPSEPPAPVLAAEWAAGTLDELLVILGSQSLSGVVEVLAPERKGEILLVAGGIDDATIGEQRGEEAFEALAALPGARYRIEPRLPNDSGTLTPPGEASGDLKVRPLAKLMRYCDDVVLTGTLEVWRGNETCAIEYRRGAIERTMVGGIDAPEKLSEVMGWRAGSYRIRLPMPNLPGEVSADVRETAVANARRRAGIAAPAAAPPAADAVTTGRTTQPDLAAPDTERAPMPMAAGKHTVVGMPAPELPRAAAAPAPVPATPAPAAAPVQAAATPVQAPLPTSPTGTIIGIPSDVLIAQVKAAQAAQAAAAPAPAPAPQPSPPPAQPALAKTMVAPASGPAPEADRGVTLRGVVQGGQVVVPEPVTAKAAEKAPLAQATVAKATSPVKPTERKSSAPAKAEPKASETAERAQKAERKSEPPKKDKQKGKQAKKEEAPRKEVAKAADTKKEPEKTPEKAAAKPSSTFSGTNVAIAIAAAGGVVLLWWVAKLLNP